MATSNPRGSRLATAFTDARVRRNYSVADMAGELDCSDQQWRNYESGKGLPRLTSLQRISDVLQMDVLVVFSLWAAEALKGDQDSTRLLEILAHWAQLPKVQNPASAALGISFDEATAKLVSDLVATIATYRENLFSHTREKKILKVVSIDDGLGFIKFPGKKMTKQHPVGASHGGLGYVSTIVSVEPGYGAFHQHLTGPFPNASIEFFSLLKGSGLVCLEQLGEDEWVTKPVAPGTVGQYKGNLGHAFINTHEHEPLLVYIVTVPFPPQLASSNGDETREAGYAAGVEFKIDAFDDAMIPERLKDALRAQWAGVTP